MAGKLTTSEQFVLEWLAKEDASSYGECKGRDLDSLADRRLVLVKGKGDYARVSVTPAGRAALATKEKE